MAASIGLVLDCTDAERLAEFWAPALGYTSVGRAGTYVVLLDPDGKAPQLLLQEVDEPKPGKNRMHLDFHVPDIETEAQRLEALGARRVDDDGSLSEHGVSWFRMADPEGNEFCVCDSP
jgi:predicted enzyme related to lactoylglutathione lyase